MKKERRVGYIALEEQEIKDGAFFRFVSYGDSEMDVFQTKTAMKKYFKYIKKGDGWGYGGHCPDANMYEVIIRKLEK